MEVAFPAPAPVPVLPRNVLIAAGVLALHVGVLWALQSGLLRRVVEVVVPVQILSTVMAPPAPPAPAVAPPQPLQPREPKPVAPPRKVAPAPRPVPAPAPVARAPMPVAPAAPEPAPPAVTGVAEPQPAAPPITAPVAAAAPAPAPAPAVVRLPSTSADYLHNPPPQYPPLSHRLREEGTSVVKVLIGTDGRAQEAQILKSSGFARLDQAAEATARSWRYVPGTRGGVPEPMWVEVPIRWQLKKD